MFRSGYMNVYDINMVEVQSREVPRERGLVIMPIQECALEVIEKFTSARSLAQLDLLNDFVKQKTKTSLSPREASGFRDHF